MIPNWLLGKSKSKLQEILGGGGGGASYTAGDGIDISSGVISFDPTTTPLIDPSKINGLDDDLSALAPKTALSNPNLLDNPWFTVNQRRESSYSSYGYTVDRWELLNNTETLTINSDNSITIQRQGSGNDNIFRQIFEYERLPIIGKPITLSVMLGDGTIISSTGKVKARTSSWVAHVSSFYINDNIRVQLLTHTTNGNYELYLTATDQPFSVTIKAIKLELGSVSTLAMDTAPDYATELLKCQRYFITLNTAINLSSYNSYSKLYTAPSDGYIQFTSAASGSAMRTIYTYGNNTSAVTDPHVKHSTSANNKSYEIFIKKGLKVFIDGLQSGDTFEFYPLS